MTSRVGRRRLADLRSELSERDRAVLAWVHRLRYMTGFQIGELLFHSPNATAATNARKARSTLQRLTELGLLTRLVRRIGGERAGSGSWVYLTSRTGQRLIESAAGEPRKRRREPSRDFLYHTLAISQLVVDICVAERAGRFEVGEMQPEPASWRRTSVHARTPNLRADLFVSLATEEYDLHWFVEVDLGTEPPGRLLDKCRLYETYRQTRVEQDRLGRFPRVLWVMNDSGRARRLRADIDRTGGLLPAMFLVAAQDEAARVLAGGTPAAAVPGAASGGPEAAA